MLEKITLLCKKIIYKVTYYFWYGIGFIMGVGRGITEVIKSRTYI